MHLVDMATLKGYSITNKKSLIISKSNRIYAYFYVLFKLYIDSFIYPNLLDCVFEAANK